MRRGPPAHIDRMAAELEENTSDDEYNVDLARAAFKAGIQAFEG